MILNRHLEIIPSLRPYIQKGAVIFDVGANAGHMAKVFARMAPDGQIYAFEPGSYALSILRPALWAFGRSNIEIVPQGLSDSPTEKTLRIPLKKDGGYNYGLSYLGTGEDSRALIEDRIVLTTIDLFVAERRISRLDFVKVDVEGWEVQCLRGASQTLPRFLPTLMLELNDTFLMRSGSKPAEVFDPLHALGYKAHRLGSGAPAGAYAGAGDYIFAHPSRATA
jgi:FkbM family methyltransferase